jgi:hypothetical protein
MTKLTVAFANCRNVSTKFVYERVWAMLCADCDVCTGVVGDSGKNRTEGCVGQQGIGGA